MDFGKEKYAMFPKGHKGDTSNMEEFERVEEMKVLGQKIQANACAEKNFQEFKEKIMRT